MLIIATVIGVFSSVLFLISAIAFLRAKDIFAMTHIVMIINIYIIPLILIAVGIKYFSLILGLKILALILINILITHLICNNAIWRAMSNKITPDISSSTK